MRALATGRFDTRAELEDFVRDEYLNTKRTLVQVARAARVSQTTVQNILDGHARKRGEDLPPIRAWKKPANEIAAMIRALRLMAGITQAELAQRSGKSPRVISELESGKRALTDGTAQAVLGALGYRIHITFRKIKHED